MMFIENLPSLEKNIGRSAQLVAYSSTAVWVSGIFNIIPSLSILGLLGIPVMKKTPDDKRITYMIVSRIMYTFTGNLS